VYEDIYSQAQWHHMKINNPRLYHKEQEIRRRNIKTTDDINEHRERQRKKFADKNQQVHTIMLKYYGDTVTNLVSNFVAAKQFYLAWHALDEKFFAKNTSVKIQYIDEIIKEAFYFPDEMTLTHFIERLKLLFSNFEQSLVDP
jgi:hypothetical protein